jgi:hypothetical protein
VEPNQGRLYESWHTGTGQSALTLMPGDHVEWQPEGTWEIRLSCRPTPPSVSLRVDQAPKSGSMKELANILVLMSSAVEHVEDNPQVKTHLSARPGRPSWRSQGLLAAATFAVLALLGLGTGLFLAGEPGLLMPPAPGEVSGIRSEVQAPLLTDSAPRAPMTLAYPMPKKPFQDQAITPCKPELWEEEINKGCWLELGRRPPCLDVHAEYRGKCYLPVSKDRGRPPQSALP